MILQNKSETDYAVIDTAQLSVRHITHDDDGNRHIVIDYMSVGEIATMVHKMLGDGWVILPEITQMELNLEEMG